MLQTIEAFIDQDGVLRVLDSIELPKSRRVLLMILDETSVPDPPTHLDRLRAAQSAQEQQHIAGYQHQPQQPDEA